MRKREREIHRRLWIVGRTWPTNIRSISFPARERGQTRRDRDNETSPSSPCPPLYSQPVTCNETRARFQRDLERGETFPSTYTYIYIYIFPRGGWRAAFPSISSFIRWARRVFVRTYVRWYGSGIRVSCRGEEEIFIRRSAH